MDKQYPEPFKAAPQEEDWIDEYAPKGKGEADYFHGRAPEAPLPAPKGRRSKRRWPWVLGVVVLLGVITLGYFWVNARKVAAPAPARATMSIKKQTQAAEAPTKQYDSTNFSLSIVYPETWKLTDTATKLQVVSPEMQLTDGSNKQVSGRVVLEVRPKQTALNEFSACAALAVLESTKLTYAKPTPSQRAQTYVSYVEYRGAPKNSLSALYLTGDNGYQVGQDVPQADIVKSDPLVSVSFLSCQTDDCSGTPTPLDVSKTWWQQQAVLQQQVQKMLASLSFD